MATSKTNTTEDNAVPPIVRADGAGKAYQSVAQSSAIAIQDATDYLRNVNTITATAIGVAMAQMLENPEAVDELQKVIASAQNISQGAANQFEMVSEKAALMLKNFPQDGN